MLDNSHCNVALTNVRLAVEQETSIMCHGHNWNDLHVLKQSVEHGVGPKVEKPEERNMAVNLGEIHF